MPERAWSCRGCGALVQPLEDACHRCGNLRDANDFADEPPPPGTAAEFVTAVYKTAVGPAPRNRGPLPDTLPAQTELVRKSNTVPEAPVLVPEARPRPQPEPSVPPRRSWRWVWFIAVPLVLAGGGVVAYTQVEEVQEYVDGMVDAVGR